MKDINITNPVTIQAKIVVIAISFVLVVVAICFSLFPAFSKTKNIIYGIIILIIDSNNIFIFGIIGIIYTYIVVIILYIII